MEHPEIISMQGLITLVLTTVRRAPHVKIPFPLFVYILCSKPEPTMIRGQMQYTGFYAM
jgi:hypothetical protein